MSNPDLIIITYLHKTQYIKLERKMFIGLLVFQNSL